MDKVIFKRPNIKAINKYGLMAVDMHTHSRYSDGANKISTILKVIKKKGIGIALVDHNEINGSIDAFKSNSGFIVPAIEVNTFDGPHFLCYFYTINELKDFYNKFIKNARRKNPNGRINLTTADLADAVKNYNCVASLAHPFGPAWFNISKALAYDKDILDAIKGVHAVEVISGEQVRRANRKAVILNKILNNSFTGGSDGHNVLEFGSVVTCTFASNVEEFLDSIAKKNNIVIGKEANMAKRFVSHPRVLGKHLKYFKTTIKETYKRNYPIGFKRRAKKNEKELFRLLLEP